MTTPEPRRPLQIPLAGGSGLAPTGAVQFKDDWPGLFLRGDTAIVLAYSIRQLESRLSSTEDVAISIALDRLVRIAEIVEREVKVSADGSPSK